MLNAYDIYSYIQLLVDNSIDEAVSAIRCCRCRCRRHYRPPMPAPQNCMLPLKKTIQANKVIPNTIHTFTSHHHISECYCSISLECFAIARYHLVYIFGVFFVWLGWITREKHMSNLYFISKASNSTKLIRIYYRKR